MPQPEVGGHYTHPLAGVAVVGVDKFLAVSKQVAGVVRSGQPRVQPGWTVVAVRYHKHFPTLQEHCVPLAPSAMRNSFIN